MGRAKSGKWQRALWLLTDNPKMDYETFKELTGYKKTTFLKIKTQLRKDNKTNINISELEEKALRIEVKQRFLREMRQRMKEKYGYANLKHTPLEN